MSHFPQKAVKDASEGAARDSMSPVPAEDGEGRRSKMRFRRFDVAVSRRRR
jgi:hypothetical protein